ncbi:MAG: hypothetical protein R3C49_27435 [Planctomycetaceae bacterium]
MPTKVSVSWSRKAGLPDYGSVGATCHVELELDAQIIDGDLTRFRGHVQRAYAACREAVNDELAREGAAIEPAHQSVFNGCSNGNRIPNGRRSSNGRGATQSQIRAINAIANRSRTDLAPYLQQRGVQSVAELNISDASTLIDELKAQPAGNGGRG